MPTWKHLAGRSYTQADGKTVTIDGRGRAKRRLQSGAKDPSPLAGLARPYERVREEMSRRLMSNIPLTAHDLTFTRLNPESVDAFNHARAEWQRAMFVLSEALGGGNSEMTEMMRANVGSDLELADFLEEAGGDGYENPRLEALINRLNEASERLGRIINNLVETAR